MKEPYREGVANHPGPELCEGGREAALEALDRGICRLGIELRNRSSRSRRCRTNQKDKNRRRALTGAIRGPEESKTPCMHRNSTRENREAPCRQQTQGNGPVGEGDEL